MSGLLLIILGPKNPPKRPKTPNNDHIMLQISLECVFVYFRYKWIENKANVSKMEHGWETGAKRSNMEHYRIYSTQLEAFIEELKSRRQSRECDMGGGMEIRNKTLLIKLPLTRHQTTQNSLFTL